MPWKQLASECEGLFLAWGLAACIGQRHTCPHGARLFTCIKAFKMTSMTASSTWTGYAEQNCQISYSFQFVQCWHPPWGIWEDPVFVCNLFLIFSVKLPEARSTSTGTAMSWGPLQVLAGALVFLRFSIANRRTCTPGFSLAFCMSIQMMTAGIGRHG